MYEKEQDRPLGQMQHITNIYHLLRTAKNKGRTWWTFESSINATTQTQAGLKR
jgi:hypothetical protein